MIRNILSIQGSILFLKKIFFSVKNKISQIKILEHPVYTLAFIVVCVCTLSRAIPFKLFLFILLCSIYLKAFFYLKNNKIKIVWWWYLVLIFLICIIPAGMIANSYAKGEAIATFGDFIKQSFFFLGLIFASVFFVHILSYIKIKGRIISLIVCLLSFTLLILPCLIPACYVLNWTFGNPVLSMDAILAFYQTDFSEASSYFFTFAKLGRLVLFIACLSFVVFLAFSISKSEHKSSVLFRAKDFVFSLFLIVLGVYLVSHYRENLVTKPFIKADEMLKQYDLYKEISSHRESILKNYVKKQVDSTNGTFVLVIGESLSRTHMGVYGYSKDTTPWQSSIKNNPNVVFHENAYSCHTHTIQALTYALTTKNQYNNTSLKDALSIIDVAKYSGDFSTYWISNQRKLGIFETPVSTIASSVDKEFFTDNDYEDFSGSKYDEVLVDELKKLDLSSKKNLIVIHLMGSHSPYYYRYPQLFKKFTSENGFINSYNNSVYYNDYILRKVYETVKNIPNFKAMVYFSDHGEDVIRKLSHNAASFTWDMARIPFWTIFSDSYIKEHHDRYQVLKEHVNTAFTNDLIFDYVLGLTGITDSSIYNSKNDISSPDYAYSKEDLKTLHGAKSLAVLPDFSDMKKIWLHRTDNYKKVTELGNGYSGIEFDCVYHDEIDDFENSHDYSQVVKYFLNDSLNAFVQLKDWQNKKIWIDFKNLTDKNKIAAQRRLSELFAKYGLKKENCYVESGNWESLDVFKQNGWKTSYYFPYYEFYTLTDTQIEDIKKQTVSISKSGKVSAISFAGAYYDFIKSLGIDSSIDFLTWYDNVDRKDVECKESFFPIIKDPRIKAILVKEFGHYHR